MSQTLEIRKISNNVWKHIDNVTGAYILTKFYAKYEFNKFFIVEVYGSKRQQYAIEDISVYDIAGTAETFTSFEALFLRLAQLNYRGYNEDGVFIFNPSDYISLDAGNILALGGDNGYYVPASGGGGAVDSVNGQTGVVVLDTSDIGETTDKNYLTDAEQTAIATIGNKLDKTTSSGSERRFYGIETDGSQIVVNRSTLKRDNLVTNATVTGTYDLDWLNGSFDLTLTGTTTFTESNLPAIGQTDIIALRVTGNFSLTYPAGWTGSIKGTYNGLKQNDIVVYRISSGRYSVIINTYA